MVGNPGHTFEEPVHSLTRLQALMLDSGGETAVQKVPEIYRKKTKLRGFRARAGVTAFIVPLLSPHPVQPTHELYLACVETSSYRAKVESALAWWDLLTLPGSVTKTLPHPTAKCLVAILHGY